MPIPASPATRSPRRSAGFTIIELMVVVGIVGLLISILAPALLGVKSSASVAREAASAQQLMQAYLMHAEDHNGFVLPAKLDYNRHPRPLRTAPYNADGEPLAGQPALRYYWHLAPYLDFNTEVFYRDADALEEITAERSGAGQADGNASYDYLLTLYPGFGINERFVGGLAKYYPADNSSGPSLYEQLWGRGWWISRVTDADRPSDLFTMVSTASDIGGRFRGGFYRASAPYFDNAEWQDYGDPMRTEATPANTGNVWPVAGRTVVCGLLDGHAEAFDWTEAQDMRHWAPNADRKDWTLELASP